MYYCKHRKREHLSSLSNEVQQLITYKFFRAFEHLVFPLHLGLEPGANVPLARPVLPRLSGARRCPQAPVS